MRRLVVSITALLLILTPRARADEHATGIGSILPDQNGVFSEAGQSGYEPQGLQVIDTSSPAAQASQPCARARPGDGGVEIENLVASTPNPDCVSYVLLRPADPLEPVAPGDPGPLVAEAYDRARSLAGAPQLELVPQRAGITGLPTYVWLGRRPPVVSATAVAGPLSVTAEGRPVAYVWDFGDGTTVTTEHHGRPWTPRVPGSIGHLYEAKGTYPLSVEVLYQARWRIGGGPWRPLGYFTTASGVDYPVQEVIAVLTRSRR